MSKILELREKRTKLWESAKNFLETHRHEDGTVSVEDTAVYEKMESDVVNLGNEISRLERQKEIDSELSKTNAEPITNKPIQHKENKTGTASDNYKKAFWNTMKNKGYYDVSNELSIGSDTEGGYLVPDEYEKTLVEALEEENFFRKLATVITTSGGERKIPIVTAKGTAEWIEEAAAYPFSDDTFGQVTLGAYKLATMIKISEELLNDSAFNMESYISKEFARRIGTKEEEAFIVGDGTGKPSGIFNSEEADVTVSGSALSFDNIMDLYYSLRSTYRNKAVWILNDSTIKAIRKLKDGNGNYIWQPSVREGEPDKILNRPYFTSVYAPEISSGNKVLAFGDFSYYWIADRQGRSFKRLNELYAPNGQVGFLVSQRVDGKLILSEAVKLLKIG